MKRILAVAVLLCSLLAAQPVFALPLVIEGVVKNKEFFAEFSEYEDCYLYDVARIGDERIGLVVLSPIGFEIRLVHEIQSGEMLYKDIFVPEKGKREAMMRESISVADAIRLARSSIAYERRQRSH